MYTNSEQGVDQTSELQIRHILKIFEKMLREFPSADLKAITPIEKSSTGNKAIARVRTQELLRAGEHEIILEIREARIKMKLTGFTGKTSELARLLAKFSLRVVHHPKQRVLWVV